MSCLAVLKSRARSRAVRRAVLALGIACALSLGLSLVLARQWSIHAAARLSAATARLDSLTDSGTSDARDRAAIAWGYGERLRLGIESPFRLIEAAARDPRLSADERRTVSWALLARVLRPTFSDGEGEGAGTARAASPIDPAALDGLGPVVGGRSAAGEQHLALLERVITRSANPRTAELAARFAYSLAAAERVVDASAPLLVAEAAAMLADREIARREASQVIRSARGGDPMDQVRARRARRAFYVERPVLLAPEADIEHAALALAPALLDSLRAMLPVVTADAAVLRDSADARLAPRLYAAGRRMPPSAPLAVTIRRYLPVVRTLVPRADAEALGDAYNGEMLVAAAGLRAPESRVQRRAVARLLMAAAVSMRSQYQQPVWFPGDSAPSAEAVASTLGVADIGFDRGVPASWRPYYLASLSNGVRDLRRVLPTLDLEGLHVRFRTTAPADSALAMHDPRTRTLYLPIYTAGGTLSHELAHDLDRQSALARGLAGYQSDIVARGSARSSRAGNDSRLAASLRALTEELADSPARGSRAAAPPSSDRPAEVFATRVDWFVARALAGQGISDGFLSAVQDELLTGHVVHPERLRSSGPSRSLLTALEGMTSIAPPAASEPTPSLQAVLRWSLSAPVDGRVAAAVIRDEARPWGLGLPLGVGGGEPGQSCTARGSTDRVELMRLAAESRARGWLRWRARRGPAAERPPWARSLLHEAPWSSEPGERRVRVLRDFIVLELSAASDMRGMGAFATSSASRALCP